MELFLQVSEVVTVVRGTVLGVLTLCGAFLLGNLKVAQIVSSFALLITNVLK